MSTPRGGHVGPTSRGPRGREGAARTSLLPWGSSQGTQTDRMVSPHLKAGGGTLWGLLKFPNQMNQHLEMLSSRFVVFIEKYIIFFDYKGKY